MIKSFRSSKRVRIIIKGITALAMILILITGIAFVSYSEDVSYGLADNLIRLHVIANSDSPEDQQLKRDVRDVVIGYMKAELGNLKDVNDTKQKLGNNLSTIKALAEAEIQRQNKDYSVKVMLGKFPFPTKMYGDITLPAGSYQALRVVIGEGEGQNWWCVLFPPLCFVDATHGTVPDSVKENLKSVLSEEEYNIIASVDGDDEIPVEIKFKVVEFFQNSKVKFRGVISKLIRSMYRRAYINKG